MTTLRSATGIAHDWHAEGSGIPLVLIHAGIADRRMWDPHWEALTRTRSVLRLDLRGFGESSLPPAAGHPVDHVADVLAILDELGVERCHLVGASFGGGVAVEVALTRPYAVESLLLCPPGGSLLGEMTPDLQAFIEAEDAALERNDLAAAAEANVTWWVVGPSRRPTEVDPGVRSAVAAMQRRAFEVERAWGEVDEVELTPPARERLDRIDARTLILAGSHDLDATREAVTVVGAGIRGSRTVWWDAVAHLPSMERPEEFTDLVLAWVRG